LKDHIFAKTTALIQYLRHKEIDQIKWDRCIENAINALPYAYSRYLNIAAEENWDALVLDDYDAVFPIPFKNRVIFKQIYQPFFVQQLGLFFTNQEQQNQLHYFINAIPSHFRKINLHLNVQNPALESFLKVKRKITHHIVLDKPYPQLIQAYTTNTKRNLKKAASYKLKIIQDIMPADLITYRKKYLGKELRGTQSDTDQNRLQKLMEMLISINKGFVSGVSGENEELLSLAFFIKSNGHLIFLSAVSTDTGKEKQAMTFLIDHILKTHADSGLLFDFEGSMIPGLARYYKGFGGIEVQFPIVYK